jgi:hypothetical protein
MTTAELLIECKKGLNIPEETTAFDGVLTQKILAVKNYAKNAGVVDAQLDTDAGVGLIVMGVADLWTLQAGEAKFSPALNVIMTQLACKSIPITE